MSSATGSQVQKVLYCRSWWVCLRNCCCWYCCPRDLRSWLSVPVDTVFDDAKIRTSVLPFSFSSAHCFVSSMFTFTVCSFFTLSIIFPLPLHTVITDEFLAILFTSLSLKKVQVFVDRIFFNLKFPSLLTDLVTFLLKIRTWIGHVLSPNLRFLYLLQYSWFLNRNVNTGPG